MMRRIGSVAPSMLQHAFPAPTRAEASIAVEVMPNIEWVKGQVMGQNTTTKAYGIYATANVDGTGVASFIAGYSGKTDSTGRVFLGEDDADGDLPTTGFSAYSEPTLKGYYGGIFYASDLTGMDAGALVDFGARLINDKVLIPT